MQPPSLEHSIWLKNHDLAFIYIPKVACTTWKIYFAQVLGLQTPSSYAEIHSGDRLPLPYVSGMPSNQQELFTHKIRESELEIVAIIREPKERILSAYLDKIYHHKNPNSYFSSQVIPSLKRFAKTRDHSMLSLELFLDWLAESNCPHTRNDHWRPMCSLLGLAKGGEPPCAFNLWTMTQMDQAHQYVNKRLGARVSLPSNEALGTRKSTGSRDRVLSGFSAKAQERLEALYKQDLQLYENTLTINR